MAATVITIAVEKGGCGKTVTTSNLAYLMGDEGKKVLCLDTDPQGNLTFALTGGNAITSKAFANRSLYDMTRRLPLQHTDQRFYRRVGI